MISDSNFKILKNILLRNFTDTTLMVILNGTIQTKILITDSKITICKNKIIISNEEKDFTIDFLVMKKIVLDDEYRIKIIFEDFEIILHQVNICREMAKSGIPPAGSAKRSEGADNIL